MVCFFKIIIRILYFYIIGATIVKQLYNFETEYDSFSKDIEEVRIFIIDKFNFDFKAVHDAMRHYLNMNEITFYQFCYYIFIVIMILGFVGCKKDILITYLGYIKLTVIRNKLYYLSLKEFTYSNHFYNILLLGSVCFILMEKSKCTRYMKCVEKVDNSKTNNNTKPNNNINNNKKEQIKNRRR